MPQRQSTPTLTASAITLILTTMVMDSDIDDHLPLEANSPAPSLGTFRGLLGTVTDHLEDDSDSGSVPVPMAKPAEERGREPTSIPSLPPLGLFALGALISLLGIRRIRAI